MIINKMNNNLAILLAMTSTMVMGWTSGALGVFCLIITLKLAL